MEIILYNMGYRSIIFILILFLFISCGVYALDSKIPKDGTVFVGENNIDISDCNVRTGDEIAFWSSGSPEGTPDSRAKVMDAQHFFVDPAFFSGKTGTWYGLVNKKAVFKVEDPWIQLDVVENGIDHEPEWIKKGNLVSFKVSTNMYTLNERPGSAGVPVRINLTGPNETTYSHLISPTGEYNLENIFVYYSPFDTGAIWETADNGTYPEGEYTAWASLNVNDIGEKNAGEGVTTSQKTSFTLSKKKPEEEKKKDKESDESESDKTSSDEDESGDKDDNTEDTPEPTTAPTTIPTTEPTIEPVTIATLDIEPIITQSLEDVTVKPTKTPLASPPRSTGEPKQEPLGVFVSITALGAVLVLVAKFRK